MGILLLERMKLAEREVKPIDLRPDSIAEKGQAAFRIHYMDAAAAPPHGLLEDRARLGERPVDVHIACVPGFESVDAARAWYNSDAYQAAAKLRQSAADCNAVIISGFA